MELFKPLMPLFIFCASATATLATDRVLIIDPSSMPVAAGQATLTIGALRRAEGCYTGSYRINVSPYFYKNEKGKLNIVVSDESLTKINRGQAVTIVGTATTSGAGGATRHIDAIATPANHDRGRLELWFMSGDRKMTFEPAYHFTNGATAAPAPTKRPVKRSPPISPRDAREAAAQRTTRP